MDTAGTHVICELSGCSKTKLSTVSIIESIFKEAAQKASLTVLGSFFHQFEPHGVSGLLCLAESHISIHTWPEEGYAAVDAYTCGDKAKPEVAIDLIALLLETTSRNVRVLDRGIKHTSNGFTCADKSNLIITTSHNGKLNSMGSGYICESGDDAEQHTYTSDEWLSNTESEFQDIAIIKNPLYGKMLFLDGASQSAELDEYVYHESLIHPVLTAHPEPRSVLILGGGEGASLREVLKHTSIERAVMVDIDATLVQECKEHMPEWSAGAYDDPRANIVIQDGKEWVENCEESFDIVVMDLTDYIDEGSSFPLYTEDFLTTLKAHLNLGGVLIIQAGELSLAEYRCHRLLRQLIRPFFKHVESYAQYVPTFHSEWSFLVASDLKLPLKDTAESINKRIRSRITSPLRFYDGVAHHRMFAITKDIQALLSNVDELAASKVRTIQPKNLAVGEVRS